MDVWLAFGDNGFYILYEFLEEDPKTFLSPSEYYTTENQIKAAVDGTYDGLDDLLSSDLEIATVHLLTWNIL